MTEAIQTAVKVMLVDDQNLVREGIKSLLNLAGHIEIVGEAGDGEEALEKIATYPQLCQMEYFAILPLPAGRPLHLPQL